MVKLELHFRTEQVGGKVRYVLIGTKFERDSGSAKTGCCGSRAPTIQWRDGACALMVLLLDWVAGGEKAVEVTAGSAAKSVRGAIGRCTWHKDMLGNGESLDLIIHTNISHGRATLRLKELLPPASIAIFLDGARVSDKDRVAAMARNVEEQRTGFPPSGGPTGVGVNIGSLPVTGEDVFGRETVLEYLDTAWNDPRTFVVVLVGEGGVGKSSLINRWLAQMAAGHWQGVTRAYGWSFYRQGTDSNVSSDQFFAEALRWSGDPDPKAGSAADKGERLAGIYRQPKSLLVLDGIEPLQDGDGRIKDPALSALISNLAAQPGDGLCIITTRREVLNLQKYEHTTAHTITIGNLEEEAGICLLESLGVKGPEEEVKLACHYVDGHPLALTLLGTYLKAYCTGDASRWRNLDLLKGDRRSTQQAERIMKWHELELEGRPALALLRLIGLFDRPADRRSLRALCAPPAISGLTDALVGLSDELREEMLLQLRTDRLIAEVNPQQPDMIDTHPLIRTYFGRVVRERDEPAWRAGHNRLYEHLRDLWKTRPGMKEVPDTAAEMKPLYSAIHHGCQAHRHLDALTEVYWPRIQRKREGYSTRKLGLFGEDLAALEGFVKSPYSEPLHTLPPLPLEWQSLLLALAGSRLRALGRLHEAIVPTEAALELYQRQPEPCWAAHEARHLAEIHLTLGDLKLARRFAEMGVREADTSGDHYQRYTERATLGAVLHHLGKFQEAGEAFSIAEEQNLRDAGYPGLEELYSLWGYRYCDFLLDSKGVDLEELWDRCLRMQEANQRGLIQKDVEGGLGLASTGLEWLILGKVRLRQVQGPGGTVTEAARDLLDNAVSVLKSAGRNDFIPLGFLSRAAFRRLTGDLAGACDDLKEAHDIADRGSMGLHLINWRIETAWLHLASGDLQQARSSVMLAKLEVEQRGYLRRAAEIAEIEKLVRAEGA